MIWNEGLVSKNEYSQARFSIEQGILVGASADETSGHLLREKHLAACQSPPSEGRSVGAWRAKKLLGSDVSISKSPQRSATFSLSILGLILMRAGAEERGAF